MTDSTGPMPGAEPRAGLAPHAAAPGAPNAGFWWEDARRQERLDTEAYPDSASASWDIPRLVDARAAWGWLRWQIPAGEQGLPVSLQIGVLPPTPSHSARLARRWLLRRPYGLLVLGLSVPIFVAVVMSFWAGLYLLGTGVAWVIVVLAGFLVAWCASALPSALDLMARRWVRVVEIEPARERLTRLVVLHNQVVGAATAAPVPELEHAVSLCRGVLWDAAGLLTDPASDSEAQLRSYEELLTSLAEQAAQTAATWQDLERAVVSTDASNGSSVGTGEGERASAATSLLPLEALSEATSALSELATAQKYAAARLMALSVQTITQPEDQMP
ncbi:hypothetical protein [Streptomyces mirabilis]|uniref:Uncharacterized protein n=1 Tax=Streptomyces mirabilis TaxID=68239 RepID=A0ABU3V4T4_9ACTN|nr:hypothetical protein [Streptomyces mirabilis]MCX5355540.1 hypothetical protein [Streptomyces mirabilis]MDU9001187.1 hypothetical protein [Streptomyces mirabilis]